MAGAAGARSGEGQGQGQEHEKGAAKDEQEKGAAKDVSLGDLPQDVTIAILMRMPLRSVVQMRALSTAFNAFLGSPSPTFRLCSQRPLLIMAKDGTKGPCTDTRMLRDLIAYCPNLETWFFLPIQANLLSAMVQHPRPIVVVMASSEGLMCALVMEAPPQCLFNDTNFQVLVFNCLTGASKQLPVPRQYCPFFLITKHDVRMFPDASAPGAYYVVLHHDREADLPFTFAALSIYSSRTGCWNDGHATLARSHPATFGDIQKCDIFSYVGRDIYSCFDCERSNALCAYAIHSDSWLTIPTIHPHWEFGNTYVFKWQGRVFLAAASGVTKFDVYVLSASSRWSNIASWVQVSTTKSSERMLTSKWNFVLCGDLLCMTGFCGSSYGCRNRHYKQPLVYNLAKDLWFSLPPPCIGGVNRDFGIALLAFEPRLEATP